MTNNQILLKLINCKNKKNFTQKQKYNRAITLQCIQQQTETRSIKTYTFRKVKDSIFQNHFKIKNKNQLKYIYENKFAYLVILPFSQQNAHFFVQLLHTFSTECIYRNTDLSKKNIVATIACMLHVQWHLLNKNVNFRLFFFQKDLMSWVKRQTRRMYKILR